MLSKDKGLSQELLAELSGLHTNYVGQVERGEKNLTLDTIQEVVRALDITLDELFRYLDSKEPKDALSQIVEMLSERSAEDQVMGCGTDCFKVGKVSAVICSARRLMIHMSGRKPFVCPKQQ